MNQMLPDHGNEQHPTRPKKTVAARITQFLARYVWATALASVLIGTLLGSGALWSFLDYKNKITLTALEQIKQKRELYERLQIINNEVSAELVKYINLRDTHRRRDPTKALDDKGYEVQNEYNALSAKLAASVDRYNRLEWELATLENRSARWFVLPIVGVAPENLRAVRNADGTLNIVGDLPPEPLQAKVNEDLKRLIDEAAQQQPATDVRVDWVGTLSSSNQPLVEGTEIQAEMGTKFGLRFTFTGRLTGREVRSKLVYRFPAAGITNSGGSATSTDYMGLCYVGVPCTAAWAFTDPRELVPGPWSLEIWDGDRQLTARTFHVTIK